MYIKSISLRDYRNISEADLENISEGITVFTGSNAQGKTNLIEAVNYLSCARSFRGVHDEVLIKNGVDKAFLGCTYASESNSGTIDAVLIRGGGRTVKINKIPVKRVGDMIGRVNTVIFAPEDIKAVKDRPAVRRRLLDEEISKIKPSYYVLLQSYMDALKNKNRLLKIEAEDELIFAFNSQLASIGAEIIKNRRDFTEKISAKAEENQLAFTENIEQLKVIYRSCVEGEPSAEELEKKLNDILPRERVFRAAIFGPHREDIDFAINGESVRMTASQGQLRSMMISFKLACAETGYSELMERPVLLLDDVFSELDKKRRERLVGMVENYQVFITVTDAVAVKSIKNAEIFQVNNGLFHGRI